MYLYTDAGNNIDQIERNVIKRKERNRIVGPWRRRGERREKRRYDMCDVCAYSRVGDNVTNYC